jgi:hypothetical protein
MKMIQEESKLPEPALIVSKEKPIPAEIQSKWKLEKSPEAVKEPEKSPEAVKVQEVILVQEQPVSVKP